MTIDPGSLEELKQLCVKYLKRTISDVEAQDIGQRIIRFLLNSEGYFPTQVRDVDDA